MDPQVIQRTRYVLRTRVRRTQTCPAALFTSACNHLLLWLENHPVLSSLIRMLECISGESRQQIEKIISDIPTVKGHYDPGFYTATSTEEHAALCLHVVRGMRRIDQMSTGSKVFALACIAEYLTKGEFTNLEDSLIPIRDVAIDGLYEYLDEQIDTRNVIYSILLKYKQRSEWFHRRRLRTIADDGLEGVKGERGLAIDLYEYIFDQHVEFVIEPTSSSGEVDLILRDPEGRNVIIDAKYIPTDSARSVIRDRIASGFHQVARYCEDFNEPEGFLVSFIRSSKRIRLELEESDGVNFFRLGGKTIYYLPILISNEPSASKSGKADEVIITKEELTSTVME